MNTQEWVNNIRNTLIAERTAVPGKAGETPVSLLVEELERISSTSPEREAVNRAVELFFRFFEDSCGNWGTVPHWYH